MEKGLDRTQSLCYTVTMKKPPSSLRDYALAFVLGMLVHGYVFPTQPQVEISDMDMEKISWILLDELESQGYNIIQAKAHLTQPRKGWFN